MIDVPKSLVSFTLAVIDGAIIAIFYVAWQRWRSFQLRVSEKLDAEATSAADYSIIVEHVPKSATGAPCHTGPPTDSQRSLVL